MKQLDHAFGTYMVRLGESAGGGALTLVGEGKGAAFHGLAD